MTILLAGRYFRNSAVERMGGSRGRTKSYAGRRWQAGSVWRKVPSRRVLLGSFLSPKQKILSTNSTKKNLTTVWWHVS